MAGPILKTLQGLVSISSAEGGIYQLVLPNNPSSANPNALSNSALEEVYINVGATTGAIKLVLPNITDFKKGFNTKIYVNLIAGPSEVGIFAHSSIDDTDTINGAPAVELNIEKQTAYLHIVAPKTWMCLTTLAPVTPERPMR